MKPFPIMGTIPVKLSPYSGRATIPYMYQMVLGASEVRISKY